MKNFLLILFIFYINNNLYLINCYQFDNDKLFINDVEISNFKEFYIFYSKWNHIYINLKLLYEKQNGEIRLIHYKSIMKDKNLIKNISNNKLISYKIDQFYDIKIDSSNKSNLLETIYYETGPYLVNNFLNGNFNIFDFTNLNYTKDQIIIQNVKLNKIINDYIINDSLFKINYKSISFNYSYNQLCNITNLIIHIEFINNFSKNPRNYCKINITKKGENKFIYKTDKKEMVLNKDIQINIIFEKNNLYRGYNMKQTINNDFNSSSNLYLIPSNNLFYFITEKSTKIIVIKKRYVQISKKKCFNIKHTCDKNFVYHFNC